MISPAPLPSQPAPDVKVAYEKAFGGYGGGADGGDAGGDGGYGGGGDGGCGGGALQQQWATTGSVSSLGSVPKSNRRSPEAGGGTRSPAR